MVVADSLHSCLREWLLRGATGVGEQLSARSKRNAAGEKVRTLRRNVGWDDVSQKNFIFQSLFEPCANYAKTFLVNRSFLPYAHRITDSVET